MQIIQNERYKLKNKLLGLYKDFEKYSNTSGSVLYDMIDRGRALNYDTIELELEPGEGMKEYINKLCVVYSILRGKIVESYFYCDIGFLNQEFSSDFGYWSTNGGKVHIIVNSLRSLLNTLFFDNIFRADIMFETKVNFYDYFKDVHSLELVVDDNISSNSIIGDKQVLLNKINNMKEYFDFSECQFKHVSIWHNVQNLFDFWALYTYSLYLYQSMKNTEIRVVIDLSKFLEATYGSLFDYCNYEFEIPEDKSRFVLVSLDTEKFMPHVEADMCTRFGRIEYANCVDWRLSHV